MASEQSTSTDPLVNRSDGIVLAYERAPAWTDWLTGDHPKVWEGLEVNWDEYHNVLATSEGPSASHTEEFQAGWYQPWFY